ncbi:hypothetical protein U3516DRAFT_791230 [Neocallimastix sp. 'constans']
MVSQTFDNNDFQPNKNNGDKDNSHLSNNNDIENMDSSSQETNENSNDSYSNEPSDNIVPNCDEKDSIINKNNYEGKESNISGLKANSNKIDSNNKKEESSSENTNDIENEDKENVKNDENSEFSYTLFGPLLIVSNCRGNISQINTIVKEKNAQAVIHCGDFGFFDKDSVKNFNEKNLKYYVEHTSCISFEDKKKLFENMDTLKENICENFILSELMDYIEGKKELLVPVYVVYGQYEDVSVIDKILYKKIYQVKNLYIVDEMNSYCLKFSNSDITIRLFGIGGGYLDNNLFNNGDGKYLHAGSNCHTWLTIYQLGQILMTADRYEKEMDEIRFLITTANPMKKALIAQLGQALKANFHISPGNQNIRYHVSFNLQCITDKKHFFGRILEGHLNFEKTYIKIKEQIKDNLSETQNKQLEKALNIMNHFPKDNIEFRSCWYWIIPCMKYGSLIIDYLEKKMTINMCSSGVYFFRHQDKHDKNLENEDAGIENKSQVALNILESLNGKKEIMATTEKLEKVLK